MAEADLSLYLNPITLESHVFLQTLEWYGPKHQVIDGELLNTMDKLIDAINKFYDQCKTQVEESEKLKLVKVNELDFISHAYHCKICQKYLGPSAEKASKHIIEGHCSESAEGSRPSKTKKDTKKERHRNQKQDVSQKQDASQKQKALKVPEVKLPRKARSMLREKVSKFFREPLMTAATLKQLPVYDEIEYDLLNVVKPLYPENSIKIYKFGSRMCGIGSDNSDLDIFVDIDESFHNFENRASQKTKDTIVKVCSALKKDKNWMKVLSIENARVPIITTVHNSRISCDIGFSNSLGHCNTLLMEYYFELQPIASRMCIYLKKWTHRTKLNDVFNSYSLTLMIIYFLQQNELLPSVQALQSDMSEEEKIMVGPWISNFQRRTLAECSLKPMLKPTKANFREIMAKFFTFIGHFNFENFVMCPYLGAMVAIKGCAFKLPIRYANFMLNNGPQAELQTNKPCVVQDPIQLNHNVTKNVSATMLKIFINFALESGFILSEITEHEEDDMLV